MSPQIQPYPFSGKVPTRLRFSGNKSSQTTNESTSEIQQLRAEIAKRDKKQAIRTWVVGGVAAISLALTGFLSLEAHRLQNKLGKSDTDKSIQLLKTLNKNMTPEQLEALTTLTNIMGKNVTPQQMEDLTSKLLPALLKDFPPEQLAKTKELIDDVSMYLAPNGAAFKVVEAVGTNLSETKANTKTTKAQLKALRRELTRTSQQLNQQLAEIQKQLKHPPKQHRRAKKG